MDFKDTNFDVNKYVDGSDLEALNRVAIYLDYALNTTVRKQIPGISIDDEKLYTKELLCNYFKGDMHSFTSKDNIRNNVYTIGKERIIKLFLKCMIEKHAYNILIKKLDEFKDYSEQCCNYITNRIARGKYDDIIEWLNEDFDNMDEIIDNYISIFYQRDFDECLELEKITVQSQDTKKAMEMLNKN